MASIEVSCPGCGTILNVPDSAVGKKGRCRACDTTFPIMLPDDIAAADIGDHQDDDTIMGWLADGGSAQKNKTPDTAKAGAAQEAKTFAVHLDHVDTMGAFFHFNSHLLYDECFRSAFPQQCLICSSQKNLSAHLIVWSGKLNSLGRSTQNVATSKFVVPLSGLSGLKGPDFLAKLPPVENIPKPYCLPMPYYVCKSCSAVGAIVTDVHAGEDAKSEECELGISSLRMAEKFAMAVCGPTAEALHEIREAKKQRKGDAWQMLPLAIRVRIQRWYQPADSEKFLAYFQDTDYSKAEAGLAGLVVTDRRLVYHKSISQIEMPLTAHIEVSSSQKGNGTQLEITSHDGKVAKLSAQPAYADQLASLLRGRSQMV